MAEGKNGYVVSHSSYLLISCCFSRILTYSTSSTTKKSESCLWVVPLGKVNFKDMPAYLEEAQAKGRATKALTASISYDRVVGFRPTGKSHLILLHMPGSLLSALTLDSFRMDI